MDLHVREIREIPFLSVTDASGDVLKVLQADVIEGVDELWEGVVELELLFEVQSDVVEVIVEHWGIGGSSEFVRDMLLVGGARGGVEVARRKHGAERRVIL